LAKPNYNHQKKQKELARQARQNEKLKRRQAKNSVPAGTEPTEAPSPGNPPREGSTP